MIRILPVVLVLAACAPGTDPGTYIARSAAKSVVLPVVQRRLPGPQAEAVAVCVIDNANTDEIVTLAKDVGSRTVQTIATILQRPNTIQCVLGAGLPGLAL